MKADYDVVVVGAGHAGIEACLAASRLGQKTLQITTRIDRIGYMSCNPSIGGLAKGHMVRELDVLGGEMGLAADETCIQFKRLNATRGPAVRGSRAQCDKELYSSRMRKVLAGQKNLEIKEAEVKSLILRNGSCEGVLLGDGSKISARTVVLTTGTFMNGVMHVGHTQMAGGRVGDQATVGLSDQLRENGFVVQRLKTGTPPRLHRDSIDWAKTEAHYGDEKFFPFSFRSERTPGLPQVACYMTYTNPQTHEVLRKNLDKSPIYGGIIEGIGPRYCPSIEDKICRFADRERHQTFLEPESLSTDLIYLQGISTSMPTEIQDLFLRTISGLENVKVVRYGYAVEYDYIEPTQIRHSLETRTIRNLFLAGQINGTSGYEEAAAQGFVAGVNAARAAMEADPLVLRRDQAYIGVLIDDLITKGTREPYRMFTSRAEHRLVLREDNTIDRLLDCASDVGIQSEETLAIGSGLVERRKRLKERLSNIKLTTQMDIQNKLTQMGSQKLLKPVTLEELLRRPEIDYSKLSVFVDDLEQDELVTEAVEIEVKYSGYVGRQNEMIKQSARLESLKIPKTLDYSKILALSSEEREKLVRIGPDTIGQASRISGINPSAVQAIMIFLKAHKVKETSSRY